MNFLAMPTLKNVRACLRRPSSMMPRLALKLTLASLRIGIARVGSWLFSAATITVSATPTSFFSTGPTLLAAFAFAMAESYRDPRRAPAPREAEPRADALPGFDLLTAGVAGSAAARAVVFLGPFAVGAARWPLPRA